MIIDLGLAINKIYQPVFYNKDRFLVLYGGAGSGKSHFAAQKVLLRCMLEAGHRIVVTRKVARTLRQSCFALLKAVINQWDLGLYWKVNETDMTLTHTVNGSMLICVGMDDPEKLKSIHGISGYWHEEPTELKPSDLIQANLRMRGETPGYKQHILSFNPISRLHWLRKRFFENAAPNATTLKSTFQDNEFIDEDYRQELLDLADQDEQAFQVYGLGEWGDFKGLIYRTPNIVPDALWPDLESFDEIIAGLDFGYNNPSALILVGIRDEEYFERQLIFQRGLTNTDLIAKIEAKLPFPTNFYRHKIPIYCDSAEPDRIEEICRAGFNALPAFKGKNSVLDGIDFCKRLTVHVHEDSADLLKEYGSYAWKADKKENTTDEPVKAFDHAMDAKRYAEHSHHKLWSTNKPAFEDLGDALLPTG